MYVIAGSYEGHLIGYSLSEALATSSEGAQSTSWQVLFLPLGAPRAVVRDVVAQAAQAAEAGTQAAIMAPTEILARQHARTLAQLLEPAGLSVIALTGRDKGAARRLRAP